MLCTTFFCGVQALYSAWPLSTSLSIDHRPPQIANRWSHSLTSAGDGERILPHPSPPFFLPLPGHTYTSPTRRSQLTHHKIFSDCDDRNTSIARRLISGRLGCERTERERLGERDETPRLETNKTRVQDTDWLSDGGMKLWEKMNKCNQSPSLLLSTHNSMFPECLKFKFNRNIL